MAEDKRQLFRSLGFLSGIGISMVAASFIGLYIGITLDEWLNTKPWMTVIWLVIGIIAGFRNRRRASCSCSRTAVGPGSPGWTWSCFTGKPPSEAASWAW